MRDTVKFLLKIIMRATLRVFWIFPIKRNKLFFMSTMGKSYSCNPKYIYESMIADERFSNCEFIWCFRKPRKNILPHNANTRKINKRNVLSFFYHLLTSKVVIYNCGGFSYAPIRKKQFLVETWHGAGTYKKVNLTVANKSASSKKGVEMASKDIKLFLATCEFNTEFFIRKGMGYSGEILNSGFPRNDSLVNNLSSTKRKVKALLGLKNDERLILYAPTFKGNEHNAQNIRMESELLDVLKLKENLKKKFHADWVFATRGHQYAGDLLMKGSDMDLSDYPDMQELLLVADILVTDYSSSIWDFALTRKPCFLFVPDLEEYVGKERGFLTPIDFWPALYARDNNSLTRVIEEFCEDSYKKKVNAYFEKYGCYEKGNACEMVNNRIFEEIKGS